MKIQKFYTSKVVLVSFSHFIHDVYTSFLSPLLPLIIERLSLTLSQACHGPGISTLMTCPTALIEPVIDSNANITDGLKIGTRLGG